jgi:hypothetical protein
MKRRFVYVYGSRLITSSSKIGDVQIEKDISIIDVFRDLVPPDVVVDLVMVLVVDIDGDGNVNLVGRALTQGPSNRGC